MIKFDLKLCVKYNLEFIFHSGKFDFFNAALRLKMQNSLRSDSCIFAFGTASFR